MSRQVNFIPSGIARRSVRTEIGLVGHSEGGMIAPIVAARDSRVAFIVMLAGPGIPVDELLLLQDERMSRAGGMSEDRIAESRRIQRSVFDVLLEDDVVDADRKARLRRLLMSSPGIEGDTPEVRSAAIDDLIGKVSTPWFNAFLRHDPRPTLGASRIARFWHSMANSICR